MSPVQKIAQASESIARPVIVKPWQLMAAGMAMVGLFSPVTDYVSGRGKFEAKMLEKMDNQSESIEKVVDELKEIRTTQGMRGETLAEQKVRLEEMGRRLASLETKQINDRASIRAME